MRDKYGVWMHPRIQSLKNDEYLMSNIVNICCFKRILFLKRVKKCTIMQEKNRLEDPVSAELVLFVK